MTIHHKHGPTATHNIRNLRHHLEAEIERMIELLDVLDGDPELEETGDEHDVGTPINGSLSTLWCEGQVVRNAILEDDEDGSDREDDAADCEPWLGFGEHLDQSAAARLAGSSNDDREDDHSDFGIADHDALHDSSLSFVHFGYDGSGNEEALAMLKKAGLQMKELTGVLIYAPGGDSWVLKRAAH